MATPSHLRRLNERRIVAALMRLGTTSRVDLARDTGLSQPTAGKIVDSLLAAGIVTEIDSSAPAAAVAAAANGVTPAAHAAPSAPQLGRPAQLLRLDDQRRRFLAVQVGVANTRLAAVPVAIRPTDEWDVTFPTRPSPEGWGADFAAACRRLELSDIDAVLVSIPGVVDERSARVLLAPNLRWLESVALERMIALPRGSRQAVRLVAVQEIRALAMGQRVVEGAGDDFLLCDFGHGIGAAAVVGGQLYTGPLPLSCELGHTPVPGNARPCGCGAVGCVETLVSRSALLAGDGREGQKRAWAELVAEIEREGVRPWLGAALDAAAAAIAGSLNVLGLKRAVITGSLTELPPAVIEHLASAINRGAMWARFGQVTCEPAPRHRLAGLVSAALDRVLLPLEE